MRNYNVEEHRLLQEYVYKQEDKWKVVLTEACLLLVFNVVFFIFIWFFIF